MNGNSLQSEKWARFPIYIQKAQRKLKTNLCNFGQKVILPLTLGKIIQ